MLDPASITIALGAMRAAFNGIQYCCEALGEGKVQIQRIKKTVEQGVGDAKAIYGEVTGLWGWIKGLVGTKPAAPVSPVKATEPAPASTAKKAKDEYVEHIPDANEIVQQFVDHLGEWFKQHQLLREYADKRYAEVYAQDKLDLTEVLKLTTLQAELDGAYAKLSETMTVMAPKELGPIWSRFNEMQKRVEREQAARKERDRIQRQREAAKASAERDERLRLKLTIFYAVLTVIYFWWFMWALWDSRWEK